MEIKNSAKGMFVVVIGPSGVGKNTMASMLMDKHPDMIFSVSATTRKIRGDEVDGVNYYYLSEEDFKNKIKNDEFVEWAIYADNYYGTLKKPIFDAINSDKIIIADIEYQGLLQMNKLLPSKNIVSIFLLPPSDDVLIKRLKARTNISDIAVKNRIAAIKGELVYSDVATVKFEPIDGDIDGSFEKFDELANKYIFA